MPEYKIKTIVGPDGKISLPPSMHHLFEHLVELIVVDISNENPEVSTQDSGSIELLEKITKDYSTSGESALNVAEIFSNRTKSNDRKIDFN